MKGQALLNFGNKVNTITLRYVSKLDLKICPTNIATYKINDSTLKTFEMVLASFQIKDKLKKPRLF